MTAETLVLKLACKPRVVYKLAAIRRDADGNEISRRESIEIPNVFTNHGVESMYGNGDNPSSLSAVVGTGNTPPQITDTSLAAFKAGRFNAQTPALSMVDLGGSEAYVQALSNTVFPVGIATGNISEVGAVFAQSNPTAASLLCSRALVVDGSGNPTTFEVLADEELQLTHMFRVYFNYADRTQVFNVNGTNHTVTWRPYKAAGAGGLWPVFASFNLDQLSTIYYGTVPATLTAPLSTASMSSNEGSTNLAQGAQSGLGVYAAGSKQRTCFMRNPTGSARNIAGVAFVQGHGSWQMSFNPIIPKSALQRFTVTMLFSIDNTP